jgi:ArsR family transcriptional regulator, arsenate/arsenite/antimonite-responsive transcriptional repressor
VKVEAESFKVLAVETRIKIIELLKAGPLSVNTITDALGISQSAVSQHLRVLKQAGLVTDERKGYYIYYTLNKESLDKCQHELMKVCTKKQVSSPKEALLEYKRRLERELQEVKGKIAALEKK